MGGWRGEARSSQGCHQVEGTIRRCHRISLGPVTDHAEGFFWSKRRGCGQWPARWHRPKVTKFVPARTVELELNKDYFSGSPKGKPTIGKIEYRSLPDVSTQIAEVLAGTLDWVWKISPDQAKNLKRVPNLQVVESDLMRINFMVYDVEGRSGANSFQDERVRVAATMAIDRNAMAKAVMGDKAEILHTACYRTQFGCPDAKDVRQIEYNPTKAKQLLTEAGYANGFDATLLVSREPGKIRGEIVQDALRKIGIRLKIVNAPTVKVFYETLEKGNRETWLRLASYNSYNMQDVEQILPLYFAGGVRDTSNDKDVKAWLEEAGKLTDAQKRLELYKRASQRIAEKAYWAPLFSDAISYAFTKDRHRAMARREPAILFRQMEVSDRRWYRLRGGQPCSSN